MRRSFALFSLTLVGKAYGDALLVTEDTWEKEVDKKVEAGGFVFVKFFAPWCGHCKKLKPDWDKLSDKFNYKSNAMIVDVDCIDDKGKNLCQKHGVEGYPTLKYFGPGLSSDGEKYEEGRDYKELQKFVKHKSKKPCEPATLDNCDKKDLKFLEEIKDYEEAKLKEERAQLEKELGDLKAEHKGMQDLFQKQKEEAMATMKKAEDLKSKLSKLQSKVGYKLLILKAKTEPKKDEL